MRWGGGREGELTYVRVFTFHSQGESGSGFTYIIQSVADFHHQISSRPHYKMKHSYRDENDLMWKWTTPSRVEFSSWSLLSYNQPSYLHHCIKVYRLEFHLERKIMRNEKKNEWRYLSRESWCWVLSGLKLTGTVRGRGSSDSVKSTVRRSELIWLLRT